LAATLQRRHEEQASQTQKESVLLQRRLREAEKRTVKLLAEKHKQTNLLRHKQQQLDDSNRRLTSLQVRTC
jgi:hypothetical protein